MDQKVKEARDRLQEIQIRHQKEYAEANTHLYDLIKACNHEYKPVVWVGMECIHCGELEDD